MNKYTQISGKLLAASALALVMSTGLVACGGGGGGSSVVTPPPPASSVTISGTITYDRVPFNTSTNGLDYSSTRQEPVRGAIIELLDASNAVVASSVTGDDGSYSFADIDADTDVRVSTKAQLLSTTGSEYDIQVVDNTSSNALYTLNGSLVSSGTADSTRNLNASSGWGGTSYTSTRAAAPFAILDNLYEFVTTYQAVDPDIDFPMLNVYWSVNNRAASGDVTAGEIGTSNYTRFNGVPTLSILGDENNDTDEYDSHVIVHEAAHYFEDQISRSDSIGGAHGGGDRLDPRVAMGEGWGNAMSAIILEDQFYRDSSTSMQARGFQIDIENNNVTNPGWFSEFSVQSIIYDIWDSADDGTDSVSLGLEPIYEAFIDAEYTSSIATTTIFSWLDSLEQQSGVPSAAITALKTGQTINGTGPLGIGETNNGSIPSSLPVYKPVTTDGNPVRICSVNDAGVSNKLNNRDFLFLSVPTAGSYTLEMSRVSGAANTDPDFRVFDESNTFFSGSNSGDNNVETVTLNLESRNYFISAFDFNNLSDPGQDSCYDFTVQ
ncbi:hypothetical protein [Litorimonas haliclonae]|uniref:hypothetical protein n=1 Tax=Litorimonas haliclonae TaxID=2081977 RepID=UPI0039EFB408